MSNAIYITSPLGRYVEGDCWRSTSTGYENKPLINSKGEPYVQWFIGLAVPKGPEFNAFFVQVQGKAAQDFPGGESVRGGFSWKLIDGDSPEHVSKPGRAGHAIIRLTTGFQPNILAMDHTHLLDPGGSPQLGDYIRVSVGVEGNGSLGRPGVYLNLGTIRFERLGERIQTGPSAEQMFGAPSVTAGVPNPFPTGPTLSAGAPAAAAAVSPGAVAVGMGVSTAAATALPAAAGVGAVPYQPAGAAPVPLPGAEQPADAVQAVPPFLTPGQ